MGALLGSAARIIIQLLAGVGVAGVMDKFASDKLPSYPKEGISQANDASGNFHLPKLVYVIAAGVIGTLLLRFIGKKLRIKF